MKSVILIVRGKRTEVTFQDTNRGIMLSQVGENNIVDDLTKDERNEILIELLSL
jgi:hypothetical protein|tara:strand:- start:338 stop:499 length:162 start_codon:yes stop_codon:yes gene_type:complete